MNKQTELAKNTAIIIFGKICTQLVSFLLLPIYTAILSTKEYGTVDLVLTYSALLIPFVTLALEQALFRFLIDVRESKEECKKIISTVYCISLAILTVFIFVLTLIYFLSHKSIFLFFALVLAGSTISSLALQSARGLGDNVGYTLGSTISAIIQIVSNIILLVLLKFGASGMMLATFLGNISCYLIIHIRCHLGDFIDFCYISKNTFMDVLKYSLPLIPNQLSWWALNAADKVIVQVFIGIVGNGLIAVANKFATVYIQFSNIFSISWTESATLHVHDIDASSFFTETINSVYKVFLCMCCGIIVSMPFVFPLMVNIQFSESYGLVPIFMIASLFNVIVSLYGVIYIAHKKTVEISKTAIFAAIINIISHLTLVNFLGIYAAAISTAIGYGAMALYRYFHSRRYLVVKFSKSTLMWSIILIIVSCCSYYCGKKIIQAIILVFIIVTSLLLNKSMLKEFLRLLERKFYR